jgi:hypothetical protein
MRSQLRFAFRFVLLSGLVAACQATPPPAEPAPAAPPGGPVEPAPDPDMPVSSPAANPDDPDVGSDPGQGWKTMTPKIAVPDAWRACSDSSECKLVETACCDHCNGGAAVAINASREPELRARYPRNQCSGGCTERGCITRAVCESGQCVMQWSVSGP